MACFLHTVSAVECSAIDAANESLPFLPSAAAVTYPTSRSQVGCMYFFQDTAFNDVPICLYTHYLSVKFQSLGKLLLLGRGSLILELPVIISGPSASDVGNLPKSPLPPLGFCCQLGSW